MKVIRLIRNKIREFLYDSISDLLFIRYKYEPKKMGVNCEEREQKVIVSLTSFPARIENLWLVVESIFAQTYKADKVILWLSKEQFEGIIIPEKLQIQTKRGLEIRFCNDLKSHKKYYYAMQEFPEDIIITIDDDAFYEKNLIKNLILCYNKFPKAVSCMRAHQITFNDDNSLKPYSDWKRKVKMYEQPRKDIMAIGLGGVLYPPHCLYVEVFNEEKIKELCLYADDIWLKIMELFKGTAVVKANKGSGIVILIKNSQEQALYYSNGDLDKNDIYLQNLLKAYGCDFKELVE